ncbi:MAG: DPP IV N-terminal domain-containing protein, partial [Alistipes sp.]|nr:DPP IV N-terminal domain-containing protein [Alistipes sp.]
MTFRRAAAVVIVIIAATFTVQARYADILKIRRANSGIAALRSMADGEHYTTLEGKEIVRTAYANRAERSVLYTAPFAIADYTFSADESMILTAEAASVAPIYRHSFTANYLLLGAGEDVRFEDVRDITFSPDNKRLAYCKGNNLYLYSIATKQHTAVTTDGEWNKIINGTSDWVYEEEYGFTQAYSFSPDGKKIAYLRFDESAVPTFEMMRFDGKLYNKAYSFKYPKAGDTNSTVELYLYDIESGAKQKVDVSENCDQYILNLGWAPAGEMYFYRVNRLQNNFEVVLQRTDGSQKVIYNESSPRYVERPSSATITFIDTDRFIVLNETSTGWMHLYLHSIAKGRVNAITAGRWEVTSLVGFDGKNIYYTSTERSELCRDLYSVKLNGKSKKLLTTEEGFNTIAPSAGMKYYIRTFTNADTPNIITVNNNKGVVIDTLADRRAAVAAAGTLARKQFRQFVTERGDT